MRRLVVRYLESLSVDVVEAADARSALNQLAKVPPDLVCLDLVLPESNGYSICEHMRGTPDLRDVPILVMSARNSLADRAQAEELGINSYLTKPFSRTEFISVCKGLLQPARG